MHCQDLQWHSGCQIRTSYRVKSVLEKLGLQRQPYSVTAASCPTQMLGHWRNFVSSGRMRPILTGIDTQCQWPGRPAGRAHHSNICSITRVDYPNWNSQNADNFHLCVWSSFGFSENDIHEDTAIYLWNPPNSKQNLPRCRTYRNANRDFFNQNTNNGQY